MTDGRPRLIVDANVFVHGFVDPAASKIRARLTSWQDAGVVFHVPSLWRYEVTNALYRNVVAKATSVARGHEVLDEILGLPVEFHDDHLPHAEATAIAHQPRAGATYDAHYLALAERLSLPFYTADSKLYNAARHRFPSAVLVPIE